MLLVSEYVLIYQWLRCLRQVCIIYIMLVKLSILNWHVQRLVYKKKTKKIVFWCFINFTKNVTLIVHIGNLIMVYCKASQEALSMLESVSEGIWAHTATLCHIVGRQENNVTLLPSIGQWENPNINATKRTSNLKDGKNRYTQTGKCTNNQFTWLHEEMRRISTRAW